MLPSGLSQQVILTLESVQRDRQLRSLQFYDELSVSMDPAEAAASARLAQVAKKFQKRCEETIVTWKKLAADSSFGPNGSTQTSIGMSVARLKSALSEVRRAAKELSAADDAVDEKGTIWEESTLRVRTIESVTHSLISLDDELRMLALVGSASTAANQNEQIDRSESRSASDENDGECLLEIAAATGVSIATIRSMNPSLSHIDDRTILPRGTTLKLPPQNDEEREQRLMEAVATAAAVEFHNKTRNNDRVEESTGDEGDRSSARRGGDTTDIATESEASSMKRREGESLKDIARKTGVPLETLMELNREVAQLFDPVKDKIPAGTPVRIPQAAAAMLTQAATSGGSSVTSHNRRARSVSKESALVEDSNSVVSKSRSVGGGSSLSPRRAKVVNSMTQSHPQHESLMDVALATGVSVDELRLANPAFSEVPAAAPLPQNTKLIVPTFTSSSEDKEEAGAALSHVSPPRRRPRAVAPGGEARGNDQTDNRLLQDKEGSISPVPANQSAILPARSDASSLPRGDTLNEISKLYGMPLESLYDANEELRNVGPFALLPAGTPVKIPATFASIKLNDEQQLSSASSLPSPMRRPSSRPPRAMSPNSDLFQGPKSVEEMAKALGIPAGQLHELNPHVNDIKAPQPAGSLSLPPPKVPSSRPATPPRGGSADDAPPIPASNSLVELRARARQRPPPVTDDSDVSGNALSTSSSTRLPEIVTILTICSRFDMTPDYVRKLNPHIKHLKDTDQIPPNTALQLPKRSARIFREEAQVPQGSDKTTQQGGVRAADSATPTPSALAGKRSEQRSIVPNNGVDGGDTPHANDNNGGMDTNDVDSGVAEQSRAARQVLPITSGDDEVKQPSRPLPSALSRGSPVTPQKGRLELVDPTSNAVGAPEISQQPVDTIRSLAQRFNVSTDIIRSHNPSVEGLGDDDVIPPFTTLSFPAKRKREKSPNVRSDHDSRTNITEGSQGGADKASESPFPLKRDDCQASAPLPRNVEVATTSAVVSRPSIANAPVPIIPQVAQPLPPQPARSASPEVEEHIDVEAMRLAAPVPRASKGNPRLVPRPASLIPQYTSLKSEHTIVAGESIEEVAARYNILPEELLELNQCFRQCDLRSPLPPGVVLAIGGLQSKTSSSAVVESAASRRFGQGEGEKRRSPLDQKAQGPLPTIDLRSERLPPFSDDIEGEISPREAFESDLHGEKDPPAESASNGGGDVSLLCSPNHTATFKEERNQPSFLSQTTTSLEYAAKKLPSLPPPPPPNRSNVGQAIRDAEITDSSDDEERTPDKIPQPFPARQPSSLPVLDHHGQDSLPVCIAVTAAGETIRDVCIRHDVAEPTLRSLNPHLMKFHHTAVLPKDVVIQLPVNGVAPRAPKERPQPLADTAQDAAREKVSSSALLPNSQPAGAGASTTRSTLGETSPLSPKSLVGDGLTTVRDICRLHFVREETLREWNPFLRRYHSKTVIPQGTVVLLAPSGGASFNNDPQIRSNAPEFTPLTEGTTLAALARSYHIPEPVLRSLNPHLAVCGSHDVLPVNTLVCTSVPPPLSRSEKRRRDAVENGGLNVLHAAVTVLAKRNAALLQLRYYSKWHAFSSTFGSQQLLSDAQLRNERDELLAQVSANRIVEGDLRKRVSELRMVVDSMRVVSPVRGARATSQLSGRSPSNPREAARLVAQRTTEKASALIAAASSSPARLDSPSRGRTPIVADVGGLGWSSQPDRIPSVSPRRTTSATRASSPGNLHAAQSIASDMSARTVSPRRGQKPSLGLILNGLRVTGVSGAAAKSGIKIGDGILRVDGRLVSNAPSFRDAVTRCPGPKICITVQHTEGGTSSFTIPLFPSPQAGGSQRAAASSPARPILKRT